MRSYSIISLVVVVLGLIVYMGFVQPYKQNIGEKVVINGDTLCVVSFSAFTYQYELGNGTWISKDLFEMNKLEKGKKGQR